MYLFLLLTNWALVCDVWYLPRMTRQVSLIWALRLARTRGHVAGKCSGDMLQRQFSTSGIPVFATEFCPRNMLHEIQQVEFTRHVAGTK